MTTVAIITRGRFGVELADQLELIARVTRTPSPSLAFASRAAVVIVALHREDRRLLAACDEAAFASLKRVLPVVLEPGWVRCGPLIDPMANGPCYHCFVVRRHQRGVEDDVSDALHADEEAAKCAADGHLPVHAELAARIALGMAGQPTPPWPAAMPGEVLECSLDRLDVRSAVLIGVAGCPRCAAASTGRTQRFLREIRDLRSRPEPRSL